MSKYDVFQHFIKPMRLVFESKPGLSKDEQNEVLEQYVEALGRFSEHELRAAWDSVRETHKLRTWPPIAVAVDVCNATRAKRREVEPRTPKLHGRIVDGAFQPWGGACQCSRCVNKTRRDGFWVAPPDDRP